MNIEEILARLWLIVATSSSFETKDYPNCIVMKQDLKTLLTAYEKEKELLELASNMLENIDYDQIPIAIGELKTELEKEKEKNKKAIDFINDKNNYFEDGENWQNVLKIKEILEE